MHTQESFDQLKKEYQLNDSDFYFLDLIPLINMIWADNVNQQAELKLLYQFVIEHISNLDQHLNDFSISVADANSFLDRFAHNKPDSNLMKALNDLFLQKDSDATDYKKIMEQCVDIAAACTTYYPYGLRERVMKNEKKLLADLFEAFKER